mgnify:FL=1
MPKQEGQKTKLLALLHIFEQKTDENHLLNVPQLVELLEQQVKAASPEVLLKKGYSITLKNGKAVTDASELQPGDEVQTRLAKGTVNSRILKIEN